MRQFIERYIPNYRKYFNYGIVGVLTTVVSYTSYYILYSSIGIDVNIANGISIVLAVLFAYVMNKLFVFRTACDSARKLFKEFGRFIGSRAITMLLELIGVFLLLKGAFFNEMISKIVVSVFIVILNYALAHFLVFEQTQKTK